MGQPHKHAELIKRWAEGAEIQMRCPDFENWQDMDTPTWHEVLEYRIKPEPPKYPQTSYSETTLACICHNNGKKKPSLTDVANMAIARAIEDGDVVPAAMLEKVADEVAAIMAMQAAERTPGPNGYPLMQSEIESIAASARIRIRRELGAIIAKVKEGK